jgi:tripartite-type tricarboxylate transporter receptor subunit TctC
MARRFLIAAAAFATALAAGSAAHADPVAEFYRGKQITFVVSFSSGGMYGMHTRLIAEHMPRHIPGTPTIVAQYMPGAGGSKAANYLYSAAPKDGSYLGMVFKDIAVSQRLHPEMARYDAAEFNWIGSAQPYVAGLYIWRATTNVNTFDDLRREEFIIGATGRASHPYMEAILLNAFSGTKLRIVSGYPGAGELHLAMERGETHGRIGAWNSLKATQPHWLSENKIAVVAQTGLRRHADLPDIPTLIETTDDPDGKRIFEFMEGGADVGWSVSAPPGVPPERVAALRRAFDAMVTDPAYLADAKKRNVEVEPLTGAHVEAAVKRTLEVPQALVERIRQLTKEGS